MQPQRDQEPEAEPHAGRNDAHDERLRKDRPPHLLDARAERAKQTQLARPLRDKDRERVVDRERAHEQGDPCEHEQRDAEEGEVLFDVA